MTPQTALVHVMVLASVVDNDMADSELRVIGDIVRGLPAFKDVDLETLPDVAHACIALLAEEDGLDRLIHEVRDSLSPALRETAYALALDVVAADGKVEPEEMRLLEIIRHDFDLDKLVAAALERGARARWRKVV